MNIMEFPFPRLLPQGKFPEHTDANLLGHARMDRFALLNLLLHAMVLLVGAGIGSFLNVVIYRLPLGISVNNPKRSFCPSCKKQIAWYHNLPVITWLMLRGKCASCGTGISFRYFFVEVLTAALFYAAFLHTTTMFGNPWPFMSLWGPVTMSLWIFLALLVAGTFIDIDHFILPHEITIGGMVVGILCSFWAPSLMEQETHLMGLLISFLSAALGLGLLWSVVELGKIAFGRLKHHFDEPAPWKITQTGDDPPVLTVRIDGEDVPHAWEEIFNREKDRLVITGPELAVNDRTWANAIADITMDVLRVKQNAKDKAEEIQWDGVKKLEGQATSIVIPREAMGLGNVFFIAMIGAFTGWKGVVFTIFAASILGSIFALVPRLFGKAEWTAKIPFGPYLAGGAVIWVFYGPQWLNWYLDRTTLQ